MIVPSRVLPMIASWEDSTIAARCAWRSTNGDAGSARVRSVDPSLSRACSIKRARSRRGTVLGRVLVFGEVSEEPAGEQDPSLLRRQVARQPQLLAGLGADRDLIGAALELLAEAGKGPDVVHVP